jgi:dTDP-4-dehydrorhamnose 3,5-epimerase
MPGLEKSKTIQDVVIVTPEVHGDDRGRFVETYRRSWFDLGREMIQGNRSDKQEGAVVGLHYHLHQADYWYVVAGRARVVLHDLRRTSPTEGASSVVELEGSGHRALYVPPGVAHGFAALSDLVLFYFVDRTYDPRDELGVAWDDPDLGIDWGVDHPVLSARDAANPRRRDIPPGLVPRFQPPLSA